MNVCEKERPEENEQERKDTEDKEEQEQEEISDEDADNDTESYALVSDALRSYHMYLRLNQHHPVHFEKNSYSRCYGKRLWLSQSLGTTNRACYNFHRTISLKYAYLVLPFPVTNLIC